jgi:hypothetical protein
MSEDPYPLPGRPKLPPKIGIKENFFMLKEFCIGLDLSFSSLVIIAKIYE